MTPRLTAETFSLLLCACANIGDGVTFDGRVVVGRRLHHRAGVRRRHPQGQGSPLWPQSSVGGWRHGRWCRVRAPSSLERPTLGVRPIFFNLM